ncbi:MAG: SGNH/GDSL hydrolase family protein, partial [Verrucomicrobia bacterium]|nr:SGNH/GDSL hydrolase family protein [Verrucomicrobiota bacterium]
RQPGQPLDPANWIHGRLLPPTAASALNHTQVIDNWKPADKARTREGFVNVPVLEARGATGSFSVAFEGTGIGLWTISGPGAGRIRWRVDGSAWQEVETFTRHSHHLHLPNPMLLARNLKFGAHQLEVEVLARPEGQRGGEVLRVVHVLVHGASLNKTH